MRIGIDMDDTICSTKEKISEYQEKFVKENNIDDEILWKTIEYKQKFLSNYLEKIYNEAEIKENVFKTLKELKKRGDNIYIITARSENYVSNIYKIINKYLLKHKIVADGIFINSKDKVDTCLNHSIDIMIEDNRYNYDKLIKNNIKTILFDEHNQNKDIINRVLNWDEMIRKIEEINQ